MSSQLEPLVPSPIVHFAIAALPAIFAAPGSALRSPRGLLALGVASVLPDADLLLVPILPGGILWHHGPTHSLLGAGALGALAGWVGGLRGRALVAAGLVGATHPPLDALVGEPGASSDYGVPFFWPLSSRRTISPWSLFIPFRIDEPGFLLNMVSPAALRSYFRETLVAAGALGAAGLVHRLRGAQPTRTRPPM